MREDEFIKWTQLIPDDPINDISNINTGDWIIITECTYDEYMIWPDTGTEC